MSIKSERKKQVYEAKKNTPAPVVPHYSVPHYTVADILPRFEKETVEIDGDKVVPLTGFFGFLKFSDANGGTAYLVDSDTESDNHGKKLASFSVVIRDEMRKAKCGAPGCKCKGNQWDKLMTGCVHDEHEDYDEVYLVPVKLFGSLCKNPKCTEQHVWIVSECIDGNPHHNAHVQLR